MTLDHGFARPALFDVGGGGRSVVPAGGRVSSRSWRRILRRSVSACLRLRGLWLGPERGRTTASRNLASRSPLQGRARGAAGPDAEVVVEDYLRETHGTICGPRVPRP